ncbi:Rab3 GTPase-activating protein regulatory subunit [Nitzschia inconspicua]|uniref:Rab3 GTPase-activating protein regulatory subunit n=1 Tax=Nitzschia inconspicua TaxID=303405 RepID=A0A9K3K525_9STRA|nr:Rab3 GTPase-activating protein regulatory subunit [Nitzschia inconspicua]
MSSSANHGSSEQQQQQHPESPHGKPQQASSGKYLEAAALLSHVQTLESKLPDANSTAASFGHRKAPELHLCRIPNPEATGESRESHRNLPVVAMMAVTERCISAQLLKETVGLSGVGAPVEVLVVSKEDAITAVTMIPLERPDLSADDAIIVTEEDDGNFRHQKAGNAPKSLMSGGMVSTAPLPRLAIVVGTKSSRVISIEFSVKQKPLQLIRRNYYLGKQELTYFEPFPRSRLTPKQQELPQTTAQKSRWVRRQGMESKETIVPFSPSGGVTSIMAYSISDSRQLEREEGENSVAATSPTHLWISFGDGTGLRLHHAGFFPSVIQKHTEAFLDHKKRRFDRVGIKFPLLDEILGQPVIRWQAHLPIINGTRPEMSQNQMTVIPIPKCHLTPLAAATSMSTSPFPTSWNDAYQLGIMGKGIHVTDTAGEDDEGQGDSFTDARMDDESTATLSSKAKELATAHIDWWQDYEAIVYCKNNFDNSFPTLVFYTSEDQYPGRFQADLQELLHGSSSEEKKTDSVRSESGGNPIASLVGGIFGIFGGGSGENEKKKMEIDQESEENAGGTEKETVEKAFWDHNLPFPGINRVPIDLFAGVEIHDPPRQITQCLVDPYGDIAALSDSLGRVSLVDLTTKQIIRMWKGYRDTSCNWLQIPCNPSRRPDLYLVIHSRQRRVVEVWQMTHGPRVRLMQVGRDAQVMGCRQMSSSGFIQTCYIAYSTVPFSNMNQVERIGILSESEERRERPASSALDPLSHTKSSLGAREAANRMNRLQQLLDQTNIECEPMDVYRALEEIESLEDLASCLDTISKSAKLEENMGVEGSEFQRLVNSHCRQKLDEAIRAGGEESLTNPHVELLAFKIAYLTQVTGAYEILHKYETSNQLGDCSMEVKQPNNWGLEAAGWTSTYLKVTKKLIDSEITSPPTDPMMFYEFATCVRPPKKGKGAKFDKENGGYAVYLSESSRTRRDMVARIFRPFVSDVFSYKVVNQIFDSLGLKKEYEYKLHCFGEWFVGLSIKVATKNAVFAVNSPSIRWLKDIVSSQIDATADVDQIMPMKSLYRFCRESEDLIRAFWLATLCRQAVYEVAKEKEEQTYGKIESVVVIGPWDDLLRRLRVCLLVSLRLYGIQLGACPISVKAVDKDGNFSVFEWLARDELTMSHKQDEIASMEIACRISNRAFDPSKEVGDEPTHWKTVQRSCLSAALGEEEREEHLIGFDDDERLGALHLFFKPHNVEHLLTPHRALLLAKKWGRSPSSIHILQDVIETLQALDAKKFKKLALATRLVVWQNHIRPIYRAIIVGFDDVPEISEEVIASLINDAVWMNTFSKHAAVILKLIGELKFDKSEDIGAWEALVEEDDTTWPPVRDCFLLQRLVRKNKVVNASAIEAHQTFVYALRISKNAGRLSECIPSYYSLFETGAIFNEVDYSEDIEEKQHDFMQDSIVNYAKNYHGPSMDCLNMGDIDILADLWDFDMLNVNTLFLLSMYEFGKDAAVDEVLTRSASLISVQHFVDEGLDIMCRRLNNLLNVNPTNEIKKVMGTLDADICEWVKEKAEDSEPLTNAKFDVKIGSTHLFGLRLLSLAASADISKEERIKIHSLIVLSGTIVKVLESESGSGAVIGQTPKKDAAKKTNEEINAVEMSQGRPDNSSDTPAQPQQMLEPDVDSLSNTSRQEMEAGDENNDNDRERPQED